MFKKKKNHVFFTIVEHYYYWTISDLVTDPSTEKRRDQRRGSEVRRRQHAKHRVARKRKETAAQEGRAILHSRFSDRSNHNESVQSPKHRQVHRDNIRKGLQVHRDGTFDRRRLTRVSPPQSSFGSTSLTAIIWAFAVVDNVGINI